MDHIRPFNGHWPDIDETAYIAPTAVIIGRVKIGPRASVFDGCVLRGDVSYIEIGEETNVQDGTVIHLTSATMGAAAIPTIVGKRVTIGHCALLHACTVEDDAFVGMRGTLLDESYIETGGMLGAGGLLTAAKRLPAGQLWVGNPARHARDLGPEAMAGFRQSAAHYVDLSQEFKTPAILGTDGCHGAAAFFLALLLAACFVDMGQAIAMSDARDAFDAVPSLSQEDYEAAIAQQQNQIQHSPGAQQPRVNSHACRLVLVLAQGCEALPPIRSGQAGPDPAAAFAEALPAARFDLSSCINQIWRTAFARCGRGFPHFRNACGLQGFRFSCRDTALFPKIPALCAGASAMAVGMSKSYKIAVAGLGTVGQGLLDLLRENKSLIEARAGRGD